MTRRSVLARAVWFLLVGRWFSVARANVATSLAVTIVGLPVAFWMVSRPPYVTSLYRFHG